MESIQTLMDRGGNLYNRYGSLFGLIPEKQSPLTPGVEYKIKDGYPIVRAEMLYNTAKNPYRHRWCVTMERYGGSSLDNPYKIAGFPDNILPVTQFRLDTYKIKDENIDLTSGYDITIPIGYEFLKSLSLTIYNEIYDGVNLLRAWLRTYRSMVFPGYKTTVPYKDACQKFTIYIYDTLYKKADKYIYYGIPDVSDPSIGSEESGDRAYTINIYLLGESNQNPNLPYDGYPDRYNLKNPIVSPEPMSTLDAIIGLGKEIISGNNSYVSSIQSVVNYASADRLLF